MMTFLELYSGRTLPALIRSTTETLSSGPAGLVYQIPNKGCWNNFSTLWAVTANSWPVRYNHRVYLIPLKYWAKLLRKCCLNPSWTDAIKINYYLCISNFNHMTYNNTEASTFLWHKWMIYPLSPTTAQFSSFQFFYIDLDFPIWIVFANV